MTTLYPARVVETQIVHLARTEARRDDVPALYAICPAGQTMAAELELVPEEDADAIVWCGPCKDYLDHVTAVADARPTGEVRVRANLGSVLEERETAKRLLRSFKRAEEHPSAPAPDWMLEREE